MRRTALTLIAATAVFAGAANARTINVAEVLAANGGAVNGAFIDLGDVAIRFSAPDSSLMNEPVRINANFLSSAKARTSDIRAWQPVYIEIVLKSASKVSNFNFSNNARGAVLADGKSYRFADVGDLALKAPVILVRSRSDQPLALESFEVAPLETPLPAAGLLMLAGLAGIGFAMSRRKPI